jgi:hypothetical protein
MKMAVCWDIAPCSVVDIDRRFKRASSATSVNICQTTQCNIPEDSHLQGGVVHGLFKGIPEILRKISKKIPVLLNDTPFDIRYVLSYLMAMF